MANNSVFIKNEETGEVISLKGWVSIAMGEHPGCLNTGQTYTTDASTFYGTIKKAVENTLNTSSQVATFSLTK